MKPKGCDFFDDMGMKPALTRNAVGTISWETHQPENAKELYQSTHTV